jgi:hypothetical protein
MHKNDHNIGPRLMPAVKIITAKIKLLRNLIEDILADRILADFRDFSQGVAKVLAQRERVLVGVAAAAKQGCQMVYF